MNARIVASLIAITGTSFLPSASAQQNPGQQPVVLEKHTVRDAAAVHKDAVHLLAPKGWALEGGIVWYPNHAHLACVEVRLKNPAGLEQVESLPFKLYTWAAQWVVPFPKGSNYMGAEVQPPLDDPKAYVTQFVLPQSRRGAQVVGYQELPEVAKAVGGGAGNFRAGRTRIQYNVGNQAVEEDIYVVLSVTKMNLANNTLWHWGPDRVFGLRAAKGELDAKSNLLLAVANSAKVDQRWFSEYMYVSDLFKNRMNQGIVNAAKLSATITENSNYLLKLYSDSYWKQQATYSKVHAKFSDYIRGIDRWTSPHEQYPVQLPSGYNHVWTSSSGQYILSNNPLYNPNLGSTITWTELKKAPYGG